MTKNCEYCGKKFSPKSRKGRFCCTKHRVYAARERAGVPDAVPVCRVDAPERPAGDVAAILARLAGR